MNRTTDPVRPEAVPPRAPEKAASATEGQGSRESELAQRVRELEDALAEKTAQLHEIDHRVKNNLQLISSLMLLQSRRITDETARRTLRSMLERVTAVATVHRRLLQGDDSQRFDVAAFVRDLTGDLAMAAGRDDIEIDLDLQPVVIAASSAAPFALIVNELFGNALKHAYQPGQAGRIGVRVAEEHGDCLLTVSDQGGGRGEAPDGFGATIIQLLCQQLHAQLETQGDETGLQVRVRVPGRLH